MIKILFVCHGSICRSPMAEFTLKHMVATRGRASGFHIASAATSTEEIGNPIHHGTMAIFRKYHIPCTGHRAVQMKKSDYDAYDYIIGMDNANIRNILRIVGSDPEHKVYKLLEFAGSSREVADPWYTGDFETTYRDVCEGCTAFLEYIENRNI